MRDKLRGYVESLFMDAPRTRKTVELKEEILQNLYDKYDDLLREGKTEEAAYNIAVAGVGDISALLEELERSEGLQDVPDQKARRRSALLVSIAVAMYILAVIPCVLWEYGVLVMFVMVALATGLLTYNNMTRPRYVRREDTVVEDFKEWKTHTSNRHQVYKALSSALWSLTVVLYFVVSFWTMAWHITWIIFLIASAVNSVLRAIFDLGR